MKTYFCSALIFLLTFVFVDTNYTQWSRLGSNVMLQYSTDNVGIGTNAPGAKLDINGTLRTNNNISLWDNNNTLLNFTATTSYFNGGNVGIGTTAPQSKLQIHSTNGSVLTLSNSNYNVNTSLGSIVGRGQLSPNIYDAAKIDMSVDAQNWSGGSFPSRLSFWTTPSISGGVLTERMRINNAGDIGIGEVTPLDKLQITQNSATKPGLYIRNTGGSAGFQLQGSTGNTWKVIAGNSAFATYDVTNSAYRLWINNLDGKIGIGTTSPKELLSLEGGTDSEPLNFAIGGAQVIARNCYFGADQLWHYSKPGTAFALHFGGGVETSGSQLVFMTANYGSSANSLITWTNAMTLSSAGNLIIGNQANPSTTGYLLNVWGRVRANEIVVNTTGADFVFQENYKLRNLTEVETFIKENKHLPEIPNAEEMQKEGMSLSEMNTKLLQKVEELTLYIIDQEKRIKNLEDKNEK